MSIAENRGYLSRTLLLKKSLNTYLPNIDNENQIRHTYKKSKYSTANNPRIKNHETKDETLYNITN
jgi:hypothetical protein